MTSGRLAGRRQRPGAGRTPGAGDLPAVIGRAAARAAAGAAGLRRENDRGRGEWLRQRLRVCCRCGRRAGRRAKLPSRETEDDGELPRGGAAAVVPGEVHPAGSAQRSRAIVGVRETSPRPVRCIQVSSTSGQFLAGPAFIPTHNSSLGRLGLLTHSTAGWIDPGFSGHVTLELSNVATLPIKLWPGMKIGQLCLFRCSSPAEHPYGSPCTGPGTRTSAGLPRRGPT